MSANTINTAANTDTPDRHNAMIDYAAQFAQIYEETRLALAPAKGNYISLKNKTFTLPDGVTLPTLDCIVLDFIRLNVWMPPYQPNVRAGAKCWAIGRSDNELAPADNVPSPACTSCIDCPNNQFGSRGKGKLCTNRIRLIVTTPDATSEDEVWILQLLPTSLSDWTNYFKRMDREIGTAGFCRTITQISFMPNADYSKLTFKRGNPVADPSVVLALRAKAADALYLDPPQE